MNKDEKITVYHNEFGQIKCHKCGYYSDIVYPVQLRNQNGSWTSHLCGRCTDGPPGSHVVSIGKQIDRKTYDGPVKKG